MKDGGRPCKYHVDIIRKLLKQTLLISQLWKECMMGEKMIRCLLPKL